MNIGDHLVNNYDSGIQNRVRAEQSRGTGNAEAARPAADLSGLKEGAVFKGEILDIAGDKVTIQLENEANLPARLQGGVELGVGDRLLFSVKENNNGQILIKPMFDSLYSAQTQTLEKVLDAAGLSPTERNFSAAKALMDAGMPIDKGSIVKVLSQSMKFEGTSMQTLVELNKMNIPVTQENLTQFARYQNYGHQLTGDIAQTADSIADFANTLPDTVPADTMLSLAREILDIFSGEEFVAGKNADIINTEDGQPAADALEAENIGQLTEDPAKSLAKPQSGLENTQLLGQQEKPNLQSATDGIKDTQKAAMEDLPTGKADAVVEGNSENAQLLKREDAGGETKDAVSSQTLEKLGIDKEALQNFSDTLHKAGISPEQTKALLQNANSPENLLKQIPQILAASNASPSAVHAVLASDAFKKMLSDFVKNGWALNPKSMKDPKEIDELYERITKQSKAFEEAVSAKGGDTGGFQHNSQNMRENMNFMEQLNNQMIYAQMPLKLSNQNANSELYVYADKRKLAQKSDGISVMLHLDMDHLGTTDIKVTLTGTNVNARFYLNDQSSVDIVSENMELLAEKLKERGFSLTDEVIKRKPQESINKVIDEIIDENAEKSIKRYTFDVKM